MLMLNQKTYSCGICKTTPDQISHHKSHIDTQKHKDKRELFELKLSKLSNPELEQNYKTTNIKDIITEIETIIYNPLDKTNLLTNNKKLKLNMLNNTSNNLEVLNTVSIKMIEQSNSISNKEALRDKIHEIHNYLRNNGAGYGMNALKVFNILYGLKKIEENKLIDKVNLKKPECEFSYLLKLANENKGEHLAELIFGNVLQAICDSELRDLLFYEIPQNIRGSVFVYLIKEIDKITIIEKMCNVLLSGKIYEYFIGRDESAISELGAYFTDRHIVDYIMGKLNPEINHDGTISSMVDMFGGSGGFTTGYINYLNNKYPDGINWETEINKISHFDMNEDVIKSAGLEFFCLTGVLPNMSNLQYKNSFTDEFIDDSTNKPRKYKYPLTNPPYGGDKNSKSEAQSKREKIKEYIKNELPTITDEGLRIRRQKQLKNIEAQEKQEKKEQDKTKVCITSCSARIQKFAKDYNLKGNDKESCSLMLLMDIVEVGGTAIGVLKEGVFFNKTYKDLRKCLIENFNVREVISVPQDQFENTSTKTSIIIFDNTEEKTTEVKFSDLTVERYTEDKFAEILGEIIIVENKGDIVCVKDTLVSQATREEILSNAICSLNGKDYNKKEINVGEGYELVKLESISEFMPKSKRNASFGQAIGQYNFYTSSDKVQKCDIADYNEECLIIGSGGVANIKLDTNFSCSADNLLLKSKYNYYLYSFLKGNMNLLSDGFTGSTLKHLSKDYLKNVKIPIPKSPAKIQEWVDKILAPYNEKNEKQMKIKELETFVQNRIREIGENENCYEVELGHLVDTKSGDYITKSKMISGIYPVYGGGNISNYVNTYNRENELIINKDGVSLDCVKFEKSKFFLNHHGWTLIHKNVEYKKYINYWLFNNQINIYNLATGSAQKGVNKEKFLKIKIHIPKNKQLIQDLEPTFQQIEILQNEVKAAEELYKNLIQELSQEAIPSQTNIVTETNNEIVEGNEVIPQPKKKVVKKSDKKVYKKSKPILIVEENEEQTI
jgi:type I restriction-modification system DNA methylase subunit